MSPLKLKILGLTKDISKFGLFISGLTLAVFFIRFIIDRATTDFWDHGTHWSEMVRFLIICVKFFFSVSPFKSSFFRLFCLQFQFLKDYHFPLILPLPTLLSICLKIIILFGELTFIILEIRLKKKLKFRLVNQWEELTIFVSIKQEL
jgi:hypothetical protein